MENRKINPFDVCPIYETTHFIFERVNNDNTEDLFVCYSDPVTLKHMNNDNCKGEWRPKSPDELKNAWQKNYERRTFIRWSVKNKESGKVIGTIEIAPLPWGKWFFGKEKPIGILRLDILSSFEKEAVFAEIIELMSADLANDFEVDQIIMKAPPDEQEKINALLKNRFYSYTHKDFPYKYYYAKDIPTSNITTLISQSKSVRDNSYSIYSGFKVGAAILAANGRIYTGCNFENASFGAGVCAERVALGNALANGEREFTAVCICAEKIVTPCGICRQSLAEFGDMDVICCDLEGNYKMYKLSSLLPDSFKLENI